jgi:hypothetical protein
VEVPDELLVVVDDELLVLLLAGCDDGRVPELVALLLVPEDELRVLF